MVQLVANFSLDEVMLQEVLARELRRLVTGASSSAMCRTCSG